MGMVEIKNRDGDVLYRSERADSVRGAVEEAIAKGTNLAGAYLAGTYLADADLAGATLPDGRAWDLYRLDPLAGICDEPDARKRAVAAWGSRTWQSCPMHAAYGWNGIGDAPADKRRDVAAFVAVFDAELLPAPVVAA